MLPEKTSALVWPIAVLSAAPVVVGLGGLAFASSLGGMTFVLAPLAAGGASVALVSPQRSMRPWTLVLAAAAAALTLAFMALLAALVVLVLPQLPGD